MKKEILGYTLEELKRTFAQNRIPEFRARQVFSAVMRKGAPSFPDIKVLPRELAGRLEADYSVHELYLVEKMVSSDGEAEKFLWRLKDSRHVESVLIRSGSRNTLCLSSQVGCRFGCPFCASGTGGFIRDLTAGEIVSQAVQARAARNTRISNIVFMGMGEPLDNYPNVEKAIRILNEPEGINIGARKITVSTCGIVPGIRKLKGLGLQVELSVSIHAAHNELRNRLVPVNRKYPLEELVSACRDYSLATGRKITLEYTLMKGVNDSERDAKDLAAMARKIKARVNLIGCTGDAPAPQKGDLEIFRRLLRDAGASVTVRRSKGEDIMAACGQLAGKAARAM